MAKSKGHDKARTLRLKSELAADVALLAELHNRTANDEMNEAIERHVEAHRVELDAYKRRLRGR